MGPKLLMNIIFYFGDGISASPTGWLTDRRIMMNVTQCGAVCGSGHWSEKKCGLALEKEWEKMGTTNEHVHCALLYTK